MATVSIRELANKTKDVIEAVTKSGRPAVVTRRGKPVVAVVPIDEEGLEDWILATAPEFVRSRTQGDADLAKDRTVAWEEFRKDLEA